MTKSDNAYKTIGEVVKILGLKSKNQSNLPTHTIRFWEKNFKQIKPKVLNNKHRYYDKSTIDLLKKVKFLLKDQGMTIKGSKKVLNEDKTNDLDEVTNKSISAYNIKVKLKKISNIIKTLKK